MADQIRAQMDDDELTTVQITKGISRLLERVGRAYRRSKKEQIAWMTEQEAKKLLPYKLLPDLEENPDKVTDVA